MSRPGGTFDDAIRVSDLVKSYPNRALPALGGISFRCAEGEFLALMGSSGSGKTTLLNLIGALDSPTSGEIEVFGQALGRLDDRALTAFRRDRVGFVFQTFHLVPGLTAVENVLTPLAAIRRVPNRMTRAMDALAAVGLRGKEEQLPGELSGGEQQRVAIARALVMEPDLLLADEPTGNLDARTGAEILLLLETIRIEREMNVVLATHDPNVALRADRILMLMDGAVVDDLAVTRDETPETLVARLDATRKVR
jgi:ABC-type lipoprotein export system ATPase subunit